MTASDRMALLPSRTGAWAAGFLSWGPAGGAWSWTALLVVVVGTAFWALRERRRARRAVSGEERLRTQWSHLPAALVLVDDHGRIAALNPAAERLFGYGPGEAAELPVARLFPDSTAAADPHFLDFHRKAEEQAAGGPAREVHCLHQAGHAFPVRMAVSEVPRGPRREYLLLFQDNSLEKAMEGALQRESRFANAVINSLPGIFYLVDQQGCFCRWNRNLEQVSGYSGAEVEELHPLELFRSEERDRVSRMIQETFDAGASSLEADLVLRSGEARPFFFASFRVDLDGDRYLAGMGVDISHRRHLEEELTRLATTDLLTGIANRMQFEQDLAREVGKAERYGRPLTLIMFDVDHFKRVNDSHGHESGDRVLQEVVAVAGTRLRDVDILARWGGEEFMVLAPETGERGGFELAERIRQTVAEHAFPIPEQIVTASFGVAAYESGEGEGTFLRRVDEALYRAKAEGRDQVCRAEPDPAS
ncbi:sensor domain-containing diguanylate cyclase [Thiohalorhabdus sp. Cl-TMA]|uniref:diguanylate cyclase n=1 Tax=Thiohalorhabdus methylotrophus TaxID=3242694 RepID=A0ABV4TVP9_9GAMM